MQALLQQLPALIGVLVGAMATFVATVLTERGRWRRTQAVRWDERRLAAYVEYAHVLKKAISLAVRVAAHRGVHPDGDRLAPEMGLPELAVAEEERTMKWEAVLLLGTDRTVVAARAWHHSVFRLTRVATGAVDAPWAEAVAEVSQARRLFYEAAKRDIGIPVGQDPSSYEWQLAKLVGVDGGVKG